MAETYSADLKVAKSGRITLPSETREIGNINVGDFVHITFRKIVKEEGRRNDPTKTRQAREIRTSEREEIH